MPVRSNLIGVAADKACLAGEERVVRYGRERNQVTRRRIIETAGRRFKADGINGSGIAALMADAGLTNGAFYAHFHSEDELVVAAVADQLRGQREDLSAAAPGPAGAEQFLRDYLSIRHRDSPEGGCPSAALLDEIARSAVAARRAYTDGVLAVIDDVAARVAPDDPQSVRGQTLSIYAASPAAWHHRAIHAPGNPARGAARRQLLGKVRKSARISTARHSRAVYLWHLGARWQSRHPAM